MPDFPEPRSYADLLQQYLLICNQALQQNGERFPFCQIWRAGETALSGRSVELAVVDDEPKAQCRITLQQNRIEAEATNARAEEHPPVIQLSARYLADVVSNPQKYIDNPTLIDWRWLSAGNQPRSNDQ